jgi:hypothetical protein
MPSFTPLPADPYDMEFLPQLLWGLYLMASILSPRTILKWVSFEQPSYNLIKHGKA